MRTLYFILEKEFKQMRRNRGLIGLLFFMPIVQLILMPLAANYSIENISLAVVDHDHSDYSRQMINKITSSGHFKLYAYCSNINEAQTQIEKDKVDIILEIPADFEKNLIREDKQKLNVQINAIEGVKAGLSGSYLGSILADYNNSIRIKWVQPSKFQPATVINVKPINWYNLYMNYYLFIVPGILVSLIIGIGIMQTAFNLVKEKETGTIEQINVTPVKKQYFILGKLIPYFILSLAVFSIGHLVAFLLYHIYSVGSYITIYISIFVFLFSLVGFGLLLSTYSQTQQQAMSLGFFFMNLVNMLSGLFTSLDSMPEWAKYLTYSFPISHFIRVMRMIMLKGSTSADVAGHIAVMFAIGVIFNAWAVLNYHKRS